MRRIGSLLSAGLENRVDPVIAVLIALVGENAARAVAEHARSGRSVQLAAVVSRGKIVPVERIATGVGMVTRHIGHACLNGHWRAECHGLPSAGSFVGESRGRQ